MYTANDCIAVAMEKAGIENKTGLYSPKLMKIQLKAIDDKLMAKP